MLLMSVLSGCWFSSPRSAIEKQTSQYQELKKEKGAASAAWYIAGSIAGIASVFLIIGGIACAFLASGKMAVVGVHAAIIGVFCIPASFILMWISAHTILFAILCVLGGLITAYTFRKKIELKFNIDIDRDGQVG